MLTRIVSSIACLFIFLAGYAQVKNVKQDSLLRSFLKNECYCDTTKNCKGSSYFYTDRQIVSTYSMNRLIRQDLTKITLDEEGLPSLGNYATSQLSDDKTKITFNTSIYNPFGSHEEYNPLRSILSFNINASTKDNVTSLFSNKNASNGAKITAKWSVLSPNSYYKNDDQMDCNTMKLYRENLLVEYKNAFERHVLDSTLFELKIKKIQKSADSLRKRLAELKTAIDGATTAAKRDSLQELYDNTHMYQLDLKTNYLSLATPELDSAKLIDSFFTRMLTLETKLVKWTQFKTAWTDFDFGAGGESYLLYDKTKVLDSQFIKQPFTRWSLGVTRNIFQSKVDHFRHGIFVKFGYSIGNDNSLTDATAKDIVTTITIDTPQFKREIIEKKSGYDKAFTKNISHTFSFRLSTYLNEKRSQAFSVYTSLKEDAPGLKKFYSFRGKPVITPGVSYLYGFMNKQKEKDVVNVELFLNFTDILNKDKDESKFYERHELGFKIGVPFNSIFLNDHL